MGKIAFVFSGQGSQYSGMGKSLCSLGGSACKLYEAAEAIRPGTKKQSFSGTHEELMQTVNTQPCLYLVDLASALSLNDNGIYADAVAGFSLGEVAALAYAGAYTYDDGFRLVCQRGIFMNEAATNADTAMCAVLKLEASEVSRIASSFKELYAVNFNSPGQTVVSGLKESIDAFTEEVKNIGGRVIPLSVSAAFHSPFMDEASGKFGEELKKYTINKPLLPVYANLTAMPYGDDVKNTLQCQIKSPVKWQQTIENMINDGYTDFIEVGAGKTLCGLIKKISKDVRTYSVQDEESLNATVQAVKENA